MHQHRLLIERLYQALQQRDGAAMAACYHPQARFSDPVFVDLQGPQIGAMWRMLCERASDDFRAEVGDIQADASTGSAQWQAWYSFAATGRRVHNRISARFEFKDGLIHRHDDRFGLRRWAAQALGLQGWLFGGMPFMRKAIQAKARQGLDVWMAKNKT